jgi:hypothetical protein
VSSFDPGEADLKPISVRYLDEDRAEKLPALPA